MEFEWIFKPIDEDMDVCSFDCGKEPLNSYLHRHAFTNHTRGLCKTFVALPYEESREVAGFYSICAGQVSFDNFPKRIGRGLPKYPIPVMRLAQLAVSENHQKKGLGEELLMSALCQAISVSNQLGIYAVIVDALDNEAQQFYEKYEFTAFIDKPNCLFLQLKKIIATLDAGTSC